MPATQFFAMYNASTKLNALERIQDIDVQAVSICTDKYYNEVRNSYKSKLQTKVPGRKLKEFAREPMGNAEAKDSLLELFTVVRGRVH